MSPELNQLRDELTKNNTYETSQLRGIIADLIKDKKEQRLLLYCVQEGIMQEFLQKTEFDHFFIITSKRKLIEDCLIDEPNAEKAISYCKFLSVKKTKREIPNNLPDLIPYRNGDKWGYCDKNKKIVIPCIFDKANRFWSNEFAKVETYSTVNMKMKYSHIDKNGRFTRPSFGNETHDDNEIYRYGWPVIYKQARLKIVHITHLDGFYLYGFEDTKLHKDITKTEFRQVKSFHEGMACVLDFGRKWGYIDSSGVLVIPQKFDGAYNFQDGIARVLQMSKFGFINKQGQEIIPCKYDRADDFSEDLAAVRFNDNAGYIDKTGDFVFYIEYDTHRNFKENLAIVGNVVKK